MESELCGCNYTINCRWDWLPSPGPELGTLDAEGESASDVGKILGGAATVICFLGLLAVMLMCLSGKGRLGFII